MKENIELLVIGGLGVEKKQVLSAQTGFKVYNTIGGSGWLLAITGKALGCQSSIIASIGNDNNGKWLYSILNTNKIAFKGYISNETQEYTSTFKNGEPITFTATLDNITTEQIIKCFKREQPEFDILIIGYLNYDVLPFILQLRSTNKKALFVLDMSDSILSIPTNNIIEYISGFDIITMNENEAKILASRIGKNVEEFLKMIGNRNNLIFITSISSITYLKNNCINTFHFNKLENPTDTIGAGDAFAASVAICTFRNLPIMEILQQSIHSSHLMCKTIKQDFIEKNSWIL